MATVKKRLLTGSSDGQPILVAGTVAGTAATLIHTAVSGTTPGTYDEIWLYTYNGNTTTTTITVQFGGTATPNNDVTQSLASKSGLNLLVPGFVLQNASVVRAYASSGSVVTVSGFVNTITD